MLGDYMKISVIIPVYNTGNYLKKCLDSILSQTLKEIEIIIVNDGSSDNSLDIIKKYMKKNKNIILIDKKNGGQGSARNMGISRAAGEYISFVDSDDFIDEEMLEEMYLTAKENDSDIVICNISDYYEKSGTMRDVSLNLKKEVSIQEAILYSVPSVVNKIYRRELLQGNKLFFNEKIWYEDFPYSIELLVHAKKISFINKPFYHYFHRIQSTMHNQNISKNLDILKAYNELEDYLKRNSYYDMYEDEIQFLLLKEVFVATINRVIRTSNPISQKRKIIKEIEKYYYSHINGKNPYFSKLPKSFKISYYLIIIKLYFVLSIIFKLKEDKR